MTKILNFCSKIKNVKIVRESSKNTKCWKVQIFRNIRKFLGNWSLQRILVDNFSRNKVLKIMWKLAKRIWRDSPNPTNTLSLIAIPRKLLLWCSSYWNWWKIQTKSFRILLTFQVNPNHFYRNIHDTAKIQSSNKRSPLAKIISATSLDVIKNA